MSYSDLLLSVGGLHEHFEKLLAHFNHWINTVDVWRIWVAILAVTSSFIYRKVRDEKVSHGHLLGEIFLLYLMAYGGYPLVLELPFMSESTVMLAVAIGAPFLRIRTVSKLSKLVSEKQLGEDITKADSTEQVASETHASRQFSPSQSQEDKGPDGHNSNV